MADWSGRKPCWLSLILYQASFDRRINNGLKKLSSMRDNGYWSVVRNVREVTRFKDWDYRVGFSDNGKCFLIEGALKEE